MAYASIFPDPATSGSVVYRDAAGNPTLPANVQNAYPPLPAFISTCDLTALPSDCDARIEPKQINAIVSEMVSLAECFDADGPWNCDSLNNLCSAFNVWVLANIGVICADDPPVADPGRLWFETDTGNFWLNYDDGNSVQWVQLNSVVTVDQVSIVGNGTDSDPHRVGVVDCGVW
jgi:hypothetical protein